MAEEGTNDLLGVTASLSAEDLDDLARKAWAKLGVCSLIVGRMREQDPDRWDTTAVQALYLAAFIAASDRYVV